MFQLQIFQVGYPQGPHLYRRLQELPHPTPLHSTLCLMPHPSSLPEILCHIKKHLQTRKQNLSFIQKNQIQIFLSVDNIIMYNISVNFFIRQSPFLEKYLKFLTCVNTFSVSILVAVPRLHHLKHILQQYRCFS